LSLKSSKSHAAVKDSAEAEIQEYEQRAAATQTLNTDQLFIATRMRVCDDSPRCEAKES
jgi:hypothetical protein